LPRNDNANGDAALLLKPLPAQPSPIMQLFKLIIRLLVVILSLPFGLQARDSSVSREESPAVRPQEVVLKLKEAYRQAAGRPATITPLQRVFEELQVESAEPLFPGRAPSLTEQRRDGLAAVDLSLICRLRYRASINPFDASGKILRSGAVEYAEPVYIQDVLYTPNDPQISQQYYLDRIHAFAGWDTWRGDTNTVIGIVDSGTDWDHPDLALNIKINYGDPVNGVDDDSDGYVDNFRGWDVSENDNDPVVVSLRHGSMVSGCASAVTDNATGVAGPGFLCRLLPVKACTDASTSSIDHGYEGIVYAADHGCAIINCSWGRRGGSSQFEQDIINYATINRQALVISSAGNQGNEAEFFPASYDHVLSVTATDSFETKAGYSNYNYKVDVSAPGDVIYNTYYDDGYFIQSGTSLAAPIAAGCAAIVKSYNPSFTPAQVAARIRATSDDIYAIGTNPNFNLKLGKGRVNLFRALTDSLLPGMEVRNLFMEDRNDETFLAGDTLRISALFRNLLHATTALTVTLSSSSPYLSILNNTFAIGALNTFDSVSNAGTPFHVRILGTTPLNTKVDLVMTLTDGSYTDFYAFRITVNMDYLNITVNDISTSVNSKGRFGYSRQNQVEGLGFAYLSDASMLFSGGLMIGTSITQVSDAVQGAGTAADDDFSILSLIRTVPPVVASQEAAGIFNDAAASVPLRVQVSQHVYAWENVPHRKYVMLKYGVKNTGTAALSNLFVGLYADWDIEDYQHNRCTMDLSRKMGISWSSDTSLYAAIKVVSLTPFNQYAVDNVTGGLGGLDLSNGFATDEKYQSMSLSRPDAGVSGPGNDIINIVSTGPFTIGVNDSVVVAFALLAGDSLTGIQESADDAQHMYDSLLASIPAVANSRRFSIDATYPNPVENFATIAFHTDAFGLAEMDLFDITGRRMASLLSEKLPSGRHSLPIDLSVYNSGVYVVRLLLDGRMTTARIVHY